MMASNLEEQSIPSIRSPSVQSRHFALFPDFIAHRNPSWWRSKLFTVKTAQAFLPRVNE